jgi:protein TonB
MASRFFVFGGVFSITLYLSLLTILAFHFYQALQKPKVYALNKETVFEISLESLDEAKLEPKKEGKKEAKLQSVSKDEASSTAKEGGSISPKRSNSTLKSLFADIEVDKPKEIVKEQTFNKDHIASRFKSKDIQSIKKPKIDISKLVNNIEVSKSVLSFEKKPISGIEDEYYAKIYEILAKEWIPTSDINQVARVIVIIDKYGKFDYTIKRSSNSESFNQRLLEFLDSMKLKDFPPYTGGNKTVIEVYFKTEE